MMKKMNPNRAQAGMGRVIIAAGVLFVAAGVSYSGAAPAEDWKAPERAKNQKNPVPADAAAVAAGKAVYTANCLACHGNTGKGDGPAAISIDPRPKDLSDPRVSSQTDGELFWKITEGKKPMPPYKKLLSETDRWKVIDYLRTFVPPPAKK